MIKKFSTKISALALVGVLALQTNGNYVMAASDTTVCDETIQYADHPVSDGTGISEFLGEETVAMSRASYKLTSGKSVSNRACKCKGNSGKDFQCNGWVNIVDKKSGTKLYHSTTAALGNPSSGNMYKGAVKKKGYGKVSATSKWVHSWAVGKVYWDWVK